MSDVQRMTIKSNARATDQPVTLVPSIYDKKAKLTSTSLISKTERDYILWHHLDGLICLVQRLLAVCHF